MTDQPTVTLTQDQFQQLLDAAKGNNNPQVTMSPFSVDASSSVWLENLEQMASRFKAPDGMTFKLEPNGFVGSIIAVDKKLAENTFLRRAVQRGKLAFIDAEEAFKKLDTLVTPEEHYSETDHLMENLEEGASERVSRYKNPNLPTEAEARQSISPDRIWQKGQKEAATQRPSTVQKSADAVTMPLPPESVLQPRESDGTR